jgi:hypothetical protein
LQQISANSPTHFVNFFHFRRHDGQFAAQQSFPHPPQCMHALKSPYIWARKLRMHGTQVWDQHLHARRPFGQHDASGRKRRHRKPVHFNPNEQQRSNIRQHFQLVSDLQRARQQGAPKQRVLKNVQSRLGNAARPCS